MGEITAYLGLGSNLGDREKMLFQAVELLKQVPGIRVIQVSQFRETAPVGPMAQPNFLNGAAKISTTLEPLVLLDALLAVEQKLGRVRRERWGPRTIDLDILTFGDQTISDPRLIVPHPEMKKREFVMTPLKELGYCDE